MGDSTDHHGYNTPAKGTEDWHEPLNENFEQLDLDVEIRDVAANREAYTPEDGAKFLETDSGIIYVGDGDEWKPRLAMAYYDEDGDLVCGELEACLDGQTDPDESGNDEEESSPSTWGKNAHAVHQGAIVFGDSTERVIWSESANELRSQLPTYAPRFATSGVTIDSNRIDLPGQVSAGTINASSMNVGSLDAGSLAADEEAVTVELGGDDPELTIEPEKVTATVGEGEGEFTIGADAVSSDQPIYAPAFNTTSARVTKTAVQPVDQETVLEAVESLPVTTWEFTDGSGARHMGPMAEDFAERFDLGDETGSIATVDADGVAFAAIQGLANRLGQKNAQLRERLTETSAQLEKVSEGYDRLRERVDRLEAQGDESTRPNKSGPTADD